MTLRYPPGWKAVSPTRYAGPDGYFELAVQSYPAFTIDNIQNHCVLAANEGKPAAFGAFPLIDYSDWFVPRTSNLLRLTGCIVRPAKHWPGTADQSVLFIRLPAPQPADRLLMLRADPAHFIDIIGSLEFNPIATPTASSDVYDSSVCAQAPAGPAVAVGRFSDLTITEYAIASAGCGPLDQGEGFQQRIQQFIPQVEAAHAASANRQAAAVNRALTPFNYRLAVSPEAFSRFDLYQGDTRILAGIGHFGPVSVNTQKDDFIFWVQGIFNNSLPVEVRRGQLHETRVMDPNPFGFNTLWAGADLISYQYTRADDAGTNHPGQANVLRNGQLEMTIAVPPPGETGQVITGFWPWPNRWLLETGGMVVQDGQVLNQHYGYDEMFDWHLVNGRPFFFYHQSGHFGIFYDGQPLQHRYNDVIHGQLCCGPAVYSIIDSTDGSWFYALRDKTWYLVSVLGGA
jgi:hypothetical protein